MALLALHQLLQLKPLLAQTRQKSSRRSQKHGTQQVRAHTVAHKVSMQEAMMLSAALSGLHALQCSAALQDKQEATGIVCMLVHKPARNQIQPAVSAIIRISTKPSAGHLKVQQGINQAVQSTTQASRPSRRQACPMTCVPHPL